MYLTQGGYQGGRQAVREDLDPQSSNRSRIELPSGLKVSGGRHTNRDGQMEGLSCWKWSQNFAYCKYREDSPY